MPPIRYDACKSIFLLAGLFEEATGSLIFRACAIPNLLRNPETDPASFPALRSYIQLALQPKICPRPQQPGPCHKRELSHGNPHCVVQLLHHPGILSTSSTLVHCQGCLSTCPIPRLIDCAPAGIRYLRQARQYFVDVARELLLGTPPNDSGLVHDLVLCFIRYSTGAQFISRLLN